MKDVFVLLEFSDNETYDGLPCVFGPFKSIEKANDFANRRIALLSSEWDDSCVIANSMHWKVKRVVSVR